MARALAADLFHRFSDSQLLACAFVHPSAVSGAVQSNQRLEFLGDRVLGLAVAEMLYARYPGESEGALSPRFTALVRREALERIARRLHFGDHLVLAKGEEDSGGRENSANLADACEAVIAALFLDGGYTAAAKFINHYWAEPMAEDISPPRDAKSSLQEWCQAHHGTLPVYHIVDRQGPAHAPSFEIEARVANFPAALAKGGSKQAAEQAAAQILLDRLATDDGKNDV
ncbi:MAG: ribonuclease III [Rhodospirillaceae bacterium]|nr:ribonuclease III [Rhodospirillaceae bacterium]MBT7293666.1 ribonuclease III [Rhodospirillaceae bacterium]